MSVKSANNGGDIIRAGLLKKLKTAKRKWFVLRAETPDSSARLEYYDSEKKFNSGLPPKRSIPLKTCFNINKRHDTKHKHVIALYTKDDCFCVILDSEEELEAWLKALLSLQHGEDAVDGEMPRPTFEHVWQVAILARGLGTGRTGNYRLCLTDKTLSLIKKDCNNSVIDLNLANIRSCGSLKNYFYLEIGRSSLLGPGELYMESEDAIIAQNIHTTIFHAMSTNANREELIPKCRTRSSSATESSKPNNFNRKQIVSGVPKSHIFPQGIIVGRERCDSMPSRPRTTSDGNHPNPWRPYLAPYRSQGRDISHSPPSGSPVSPPSAGCSTDSTGSSYSIADETDMCMDCPESLRYNIPLTPDEAIVEEECLESPYGMSNTYVPMAPQSSDDGYVDMSPQCRHSTNSPTTSTTSITSGTPSTDIRFSDYPLDKVSSYLASEDDDTRPARAYSVGSRPEAYHNKRQVELAGTPENSRVRAFSVGSKTKRGPSRVLPPHHSHSGVKSSSAPILTNSKNHNSHGSIGPMDDLMEMDFSRSNTRSSTNSDLNKESSETPSGYVEMKPGVDPSQRKISNLEVSPYVDMKGGSDYMDMSGTSPSKNHNSDYTFVDINKQYGMPLSNENYRSNYVDMDQAGRNKSLSLMLNNKQSTSPGSSWGNEDYLDMSSNHVKERVMSISPRSNDYMPLNYQQHDINQPKTPEGYVEMTPGKTHQRQSSFDSSQINTFGDTYISMSLGQSSKKKHNKKDKTISQPISIYPNSSSSQTGKNSSSPISISSLWGRKSSSGTPPKMHLPLHSFASSYSSLPRQRSRKDSHTNSKDSSSSSITTPSSSSTIFPLSLNSPSSPMKPQSKIETPTALKIPAAVLNTIYKSKVANTKPTITTTSNDDYTVMNFEGNRNKSDYVNYSGPSGRVTTLEERTPSATDAQDGRRFRPIQNDTENGDYLFASFEEIPPAQKLKESKARDSPYELLRASETRISLPNLMATDGSKNVSPTPHFAGDNSRSSSVSSETSKGPVSRPSSTSSELWSSSSTVVSCPASDTVQDGQTAEPSKIDIKLHYASLDLAQSLEEEEKTVGAKAPANNSSNQSQNESSYAEIDFIKSEDLKQNHQSGRVKH